MQQHTKEELENRADEIPESCSDDGQITDGSLLDSIYELMSWDDLDDDEKIYYLNHILKKKSHNTNQTHNQHNHTQQPQSTKNTKLQYFYENQNAKGKELLDTAFIYLCGYSLETLISEV